jgi:hypothetical protein
MSSTRAVQLHKKPDIQLTFESRKLLSCRSPAIFPSSRLARCFSCQPRLKSARPVRVQRSQRMRLAEALRVRRRSVRIPSRTCRAGVEGRRRLSGRVAIGSEHCQRFARATAAGSRSVSQRRLDSRAVAAGRARVRGGGVPGGAMHPRSVLGNGGYDLIDLAAALGAVGFRCVYPASIDPTSDASQP